MKGMKRPMAMKLFIKLAEKIIKRKAPTFVQPILQWEKKQNVVITDSYEADISFERFVNFIAFEVEFNIITHGSLHWWPYTNLCHLCHIHHGRFHLHLLGFLVHVFTGSRLESTS